MRRHKTPSEPDDFTIHAIAMDTPIRPIVIKTPRTPRQGGAFASGPPNRERATPPCFLPVDRKRRRLSSRMPPCKNDQKRTYAGTEPSPKGLGICAHAESAGKVSRGKDGRLWQVALDKNGTKSWKPLKGPAWPYGPMTLPRALKALSIIEADADSIVDLKVAMLKAVDLPAQMADDRFRRILARRNLQSVPVLARARLPAGSGPGAHREVGPPRIQEEVGKMAGRVRAPHETGAAQVRREQTFMSALRL